MNWTLMALAIILLGTAFLMWLGYKKIKRKQALGELPKNYSPFERLNRMVEERDEDELKTLEELKPQDIKIIK